MFATFFITGSTIKYLLDASNIWYAAGTLSLGGVINTFSAFIALFVLFILPFRPVRRWIWNNVFSKTKQTTVGSKFTTKSFKTTSKVKSNDSLDDRLSKNITSTRLSDNHFIVKIK